LYEWEKFGALLQAFGFTTANPAHFKEVIFESVDLDMIHQSEWDALDLCSTILVRVSLVSPDTRRPKSVKHQGQT
jgi:hypothetical protein